MKLQIGTIPVRKRRRRPPPIAQEEEFQMSIDDSNVALEGAGAFEASNLGVQSNMSDLLAVPTTSRRRSAPSLVEDVIEADEPVAGPSRQMPSAPYTPCFGGRESRK